MMRSKLVDGGDGGKSQPWNEASGRDWVKLTSIKRRDKEHHKVSEERCSYAAT